MQARTHEICRLQKFHWRRNDLYFGGGGGGGLIQYHVQFMCSIIACLIHDQANIGGAIAPPAPMVPTPM